jgi:lysophospholipase L1-like esterase
MTMRRWCVLTLCITLIGSVAFAQSAPAPAPAPAPATSATKSASRRAAATTTKPLPKQSPDVPAIKYDARTGEPNGAFMEKHKTFVERAKQGDVDLLFMGDSITEGWKKAPELFKQRYEDKYKTANFGIGGDRTQHVLWRQENGELDNIKPKVTVLMIGTNNARDDNPDDVARAIEKIVKELKDKTGTKVLLLGIFPRGQTASDPLRIKNMKVNDKIKMLDDGKTVRYLDIGSKFVDPDGSIEKEIMPDFLHPSPKGYEIWADAMDPLLAEMMSEK